eukprot:jgi/Picre1/31650/NNA_007001.t1
MSRAFDPHPGRDCGGIPVNGVDEIVDASGSGQAAALAGGTTFHIDFALPVDHDLMAGYEEWRRKSKDSVMDYGFHMAVTSWSDKVKKDMETLVRSHGINSFKFFMAYKGALMVTDTELLQGFSQCKELGAIPQVHAENGDAVAHGQDYVVNSLGVTGPEGHACLDLKY